MPCETELWPAILGLLAMIENGMAVQPQLGTLTSTCEIGRSPSFVTTTIISSSCGPPAVRACRLRSTEADTS